MPNQTMTSFTTGVGQLLKEKSYFEVPLHQRDYSWPIGAVEQYLTDIVDAMERQSPEYFVGLIVLIPPEDGSAKRHHILDGQQRLATTTMIYAAVRQLLRADGFDSDAQKIQDSFIGMTEIGEDQAEARIVLNINNRGTFDEAVVKQCSDDDLENWVEAAGRFSSTKLLLEAVKLCRGTVSALARAKGEKEARKQFLAKLAIYIRDSVQTNCLLVSSAENAYTIFESLNDRGIDLSVLDLLKNHIFREAGEGEKDRVQSEWTKMTARLGDRDTDHFLKAYWTSRYGRIQKGRLFHELKRRHSSKEQVLSLVSELSVVAETYANLDIADSDLWKQYGEDAQEAISTLAILGSLQTRPILLAALAKFSEADVPRLLRYLVVLIVRYQLVGRGRTGRLEIVSASVAEGIFSGRLRSPKAAWDDLKQIVPQDEDFRQDFSRYSEGKAQRARYILRRLEEQRWLDENPGKTLQLDVTSDPKRVNLEHILPKNPDALWASVTSGDKAWEDLLDRIGNLCLLDRPTNKKESSGSFASKSASYRTSPFALTSSIPTKFSAWDRSAIDDRQRELATLAVRAWPI